MKMEFNSVKSDFSLTKKDAKIYEVKYGKWLSSKAKTDYLNHQIEIKSKNIWTSKFGFYKDGIEIGDLTFNWKGYMIISMKNNDSQEHCFTMKAKGLWKRRFEVRDKN